MVAEPHHLDRTGPAPHPLHLPASAHLRGRCVDRLLCLSATGNRFSKVLYTVLINTANALNPDFSESPRQLPGGLMLAFPGMILQVALIATFAVHALPYGWGWTEALLFGSILSATDPVAVIALMKELGLLSDLRVLIEAESLLNDGAAIVVFELCHMILVHPASVNVYVTTAFQFVLGAPALGVGLFLASWYWLIKTDDPVQDTMVTVCTSYLCYFAAEAGGAKVSRVLSVLTIGISII